MLSQQWQTLTQCYCIIEQSHLLKAVSAVLSMLSYLKYRRPLRILRSTDVEATHNLYSMSVII